MLEIVNKLGAMLMNTGAGSAQDSSSSSSNKGGSAASAAAAAAAAAFDCHDVFLIGVRDVISSASDSVIGAVAANLATIVLKGLQALGTCVRNERGTGGRERGRE